MSTTASITAAQLYDMSRDGQRRELVLGEVRMMSPSGWKHGRIAGKLHTLLGQHVISNGLGTVFTAETGFLVGRDPDTVRAPDIAFISNDNMPDDEPSDAYWPGPPDLAVEVLSPGDRTSEVDDKIRAWLDAGARMVWVVDPKLQTVTVYRSATDISVRASGQQLDGCEVVPGFACSVDEIFS